MTSPFLRPAVVAMAAGALSFAILAATAATSAAQAAPPDADGGESSHPLPPAHGRNPEFDAAMQACAAEQGVAPLPAPGHRPAPGERGEADEGKGKRPDMKKLEACMAAKGFARPRGGPGGDRPPPPPER